MRARERSQAAGAALMCAALLIVIAAAPVAARMAGEWDVVIGRGLAIPAFEIQTVVHGVSVDVDPDVCRDAGTFATKGSLQVALGDTLARDIYQFGGALHIDGVVKGDVISWVQTARVGGEVTQDLNVFAQDVSVTGRVGDDLRAFCQSVALSGTVGSDMLALAGTVDIGPGAVVEGNLRAACGVATMNGTVAGDLVIYTGKAVINGRVLGDAIIAGDGGIDFGEKAEIMGNLLYHAPAPITLRPDLVHGNVSFKPTEAEEKHEFKFPKGLGVGFRIFLFIAAVIAGSILIALTRDHADRTATIIRRKPLKSLAIGFIAFICVPIIVIIAIALILTIPLAMVLALAYAIAAYIAKFYVAVCVGRLVLRRGDGQGPPVPMLLLGLAILYLLTAVPYAGTIISFLIVFLGLGALLQRKETRLDKVFEQQAEPNEALPGAFPAPPAPPGA